MKYLAHLTGKEMYWGKAEKVMKVLNDNGMEASLLPVYVNPETGRFTSREFVLEGVAIRIVVLPARSSLHEY